MNFRRDFSSFARIMRDGVFGLGFYASQYPWESEWKHSGSIVEEVEANAGVDKRMIAASGRSAL
jgi:hypothetical protein